MAQPNPTLLAWDTDFFGYPVGRLEYPGSPAALLTALQRGQANGFKLIYLHASEALDFSADFRQAYPSVFEDKKILFRKNISLPEKQSIPEKRSIINEKIQRFTGTIASPELIQLALQSGIYSRFARDTRFQKPEYEALYTEWMQKSVTGELADEIWVSTSPTGYINGMATLGKRENTAFISLLAVAMVSQGQGYGTKLIQTAARRASEWGCTTLEVGTQSDNLPACGLYQRTGFSLFQTSYLYHIWL